MAKKKRRILEGDGWSFGEEHSSSADSEKFLPLEKQSPRLRWERRKGGGGVTLVDELKMDSADLKDLGSTLRKLCSAGGKSAKGEIEVQGDHREKIRTWFQSKSIKVRG